MIEVVESSPVIVEEELDGNALTDLKLVANLDLLQFIYNISIPMVIIHIRIYLTRPFLESITYNHSCAVAVLGFLIVLHRLGFRWVGDWKYEGC